MAPQRGEGDCELALRREQEERENEIGEVRRSRLYSRKCHSTNTIYVKKSKGRIR